MKIKTDNESSLFEELLPKGKKEQNAARKIHLKSGIPLPMLLIFYINLKLCKGSKRPVARNSMRSKHRHAERPHTYFFNRYNYNTN